MSPLLNSDESTSIILKHTHVHGKARLIALFQFSSVAQSCLTLCDPMDGSMPGFHVHHQLLEPTQTRVHCFSEPVQPSHPLSSPFPPT